MYVCVRNGCLGFENVYWPNKAERACVVLREGGINIVRTEERLEPDLHIILNKLDS